MAAFFIGNYSFRTNPNIVRVLKKDLFEPVPKRERAFGLGLEQALGENRSFFFLQG
jgi:hypothetical protein